MKQKQLVALKKRIKNKTKSILEAKCIVVGVRLELLPERDVSADSEIARLKAEADYERNKRLKAEVELARLIADADNKRLKTVRKAEK